MSEVMWGKIPNLPRGRFYEVSSTGVVRNGRTKTRVKSTLTNSGYERVIFGSKHKGSVVWRYVHRCVVEAFLGPIQGGLEVNHLDGNKLNNALTNLEVCTRSENIKHNYSNLGFKSHNIRLTPEDACKIRGRVQGGESQASIAEEYGVSKMVVSRLWRFVQDEYKCVCGKCAEMVKRRFTNLSYKPTGAEEATLRSFAKGKINLTEAAKEMSCCIRTVHNRINTPAIQSLLFLQAEDTDGR